MTPQQQRMAAYAHLRARYTYADYDAAKQAWQARHPEATPEQYQGACLRIAKRMGL